MDESSFEKKSTKKLWIVIAILVIIAAAVVGGIFFLKERNNPKKIFTSKIEDAFKMTENEKKEVKSGRVQLELSAELDTNNAEITMVSPMIEALKLNSVTEFDIEEKLFNQKLTAYYNNKEVIDVDTLVQNEKMYLYLNELFNKYIDCTNLLEDELDISTLFEESKEIANSNLLNKDLIKDIKNVVKDYIKEQEFTQEKDEVNGEKVKKTTCLLTEKELAEFGLNIFKKVNEYEKSEDIEDLIDEIEDALKDEDSFDSDNYIEISLYTKGLKNELVKATIGIFEDEEILGTIEIVKEENKTTVTIVSEDVLFAIVITENDNITTMEILVNPEEAKLSSAISLATITVNEVNENEGTIKFTVHAGPIMALEDDDYEGTKLDVTLNIKYKVDYNAKIEKRDVKKSIDAEELTEYDLNTILENAQKNEILKALISEFAY